MFLIYEECMHYFIKEKNAHPKTQFIFRYTLLFFLCIFLSACGSKDADMGEDSLISVKDSVGEDYSHSVLDDGLSLEQSERKAFYSTAELDKDLSAKELKIIEVYYKNYLHKSKKSLSRFMYRAVPYLPTMMEIFKQKGVPKELAYLAFIESGYNPWAVSKSNAVGMWQFMSFTGRHYGLVQDWWMDERRDPYKAAEAAATYLLKLYNDFNDWNLAIAAYNAGEGKIGRALKATETNDFFSLIAKNDTLTGSLKIKEETLQYVPRFLAMIKIMRNFHTLGLKVEAHDFKGNKPIIPEPAVGVMAKAGTDLASVAKDLGMTWTMFAAYNPAFRRYISPPDREVMFYVPTRLKEEAIVASKASKNSGWGTYTVVKGDTLTKISRKTGVPIRILRQANHKSEPLQIGARLRIPASESRAMAQNSSNIPTIEKKGYYYTMKRGDVVSVVANRHGLSTKEVLDANPRLGNVRNVQAGQKIYIPSDKVNTRTASQADKMTSSNAGSQQRSPSPRSSASTSNQSQRSSKSHTVKNGDTLYSIANTYGLSVKNLRAMNTHISGDKLRLGQKVNLVQAQSGSAVASKSYTIKSGESIYSISKKLGIKQSELLALNPQINDITKIKSGQKIKIPSKVNTQATQNSSNSHAQNVTKYVVSRGDTYWNISRRFSMSVDELLALNKLEKSDTLSIGKQIKVYTN